MIIIIPILIYCILVLGIILLTNKSLKGRARSLRKKIRKRIITISVILFFPLLFFYFSYLFSLALDNHYDVKKGTFLWYATMDNNTITDFPLIKPKSRVIYNSIGGDGPNIGTGWGIEYVSEEENQMLVKKIIDYLKSEGYEIKEVTETQYYWPGKNKKNETNQLFSGANEKGESLDIMFEKQMKKLTKIECTIVY